MNFKEELNKLKINNIKMEEEKTKMENGKKKNDGLYVTGTHQNLQQKILAIRKAMPYFQKDTTGYQYQYVSGCKVLETFRDIADSLGVLLTTSIIESGMIGKIVYAKILYTFIDTESGEELPVPFYGYGEQSDASKAFGSMLTYSERYFLLKFFNVPTDKDDPDAHQEPVKVEIKERKSQLNGDDSIVDSIFISKAERDAWDKKKDGPDRDKAISYIKEKIKLGEKITKTLKAKNKKDNDIAKVISLEFMPLTVDKAKEKFADLLN